ncbi:sulfurtransferase [Ferviditalea candida]|uniref:thiosulfate sulfurtransferase n=1 Tax=Ferviditalea candida TaxID=3108399 RepID=A0ABU5ZH45_9BACL|nr:sulfurtransferase [Paenibacillaceae bacterium T2]
MQKRLKLKLMLGILSVVFITVLAACGSKSNSGESTGAAAGAKTGGDYPNSQLLADVNWVNDHLNDPKVVLIDARAKGYEEGHIRGAVNLKTGDINDPKNPVKGFLLGEEAFGEVIRKLGVNQDSTVLVYDEGNALSATRIFYAFEYYGLRDQVKVLNGGYPAWLAAGKDVSTDAPQIAPGNFTAKANAALISTKAEITGELNDPKLVFLDARSADEYTGKDLRGNKNGGHIPGAVNRDWSESIQKGEDGIERFKSYETLKAEFEKIGTVKDKTVVPYCQTNVRGAHTYFTLRLLGYSDIRPYEGSWSEWGNAIDTKIEK